MEQISGTLNGIGYRTAKELEEFMEDINIVDKREEEEDEEDEIQGEDELPPPLLKSNGVGNSIKSNNSY